MRLIRLLQNLRTDSISISLSEGGGTNNGSSASSSHSPFSARSNPSVNSSVTDVRSCASLQPSASATTSQKATKKTKNTSTSLKSHLMNHLGKRSPMVTRKEVRRIELLIELNRSISASFIFFISLYQLITMILLNQFVECKNRVSMINVVI